jgi:hypothetical protein
MGNPISGQAKIVFPGYRLKAQDINRFGDADNQGAGVFPAPFSYGGRFPGGTVVVPNSAGGSAAPAAVTIFPPWYPFLNQDGSGNYQANFYPGTFAGLLPTGILAALALTQSAVNYIYLAVTATSGQITAATLTASTTYPTLASNNSGTPPAAFNVPIAIADLTLTKPAIANLVGFGNIWCQPFVAFFDTISTGALNTAPFTPWYNWEWSGTE